MDVDVIFSHSGPYGTGYATMAHTKRSSPCGCCGPGAESWCLRLPCFVCACSFHQYLLCEHWLLCHWKGCEVLLLYVCVCLLSYLANHVAVLHQVLCVCWCVATALTALQYIMYFWFVDDVMFSHYGPSGDRIAQQPKLLQQFQPRPDFAHR